MAQNPIGMASRLIGIPVRAEIRLITGKYKAAAPTFCMNELMTATVPDTIGMMRASVVPPRFRISAATFDISPVLSRPAPTIITAMIEMTAFEANPLKRCCRSASRSRPGM